MKSQTLDISELKKNLYKMSTDKLQEVNDFIEFIIEKSKVSNKKNVKSLEGIWKNLGFEKIKNLEQSIKEIREEISGNFNDKINKWTT
jgi:hypothetical protein